MRHERACLTGFLVVEDAPPAIGLSGDHRLDPAFLEDDAERGRYGIASRRQTSQLGGTARAGFRDRRTSHLSTEPAHVASSFDATGPLLNVGFASDFVAKKARISLISGTIDGKCDRLSHLTERLPTKLDLMIELTYCFT
jgi:hypothetical protein